MQLTLSLAVLAFMVLVMLSAWLFSLVVKNGGWTDVFWTFGTGGTLAAVALWPDPGANVHRRDLVATFVVLWAVRLGVYLVSRVGGHAEDARYAQARAQYGDKFKWGLLFIGLSQAPATALLAPSVIEAAHRPGDVMGLRELAAIAIFALAILGEAVADEQMRRFKANPANKGRVCDVGLWGWSRHPNYFFEWLGWLAYPAIALDPAVPLSWASLTAPVVMLVLLTRVSGVPPLEKAMLQSRGKAYQDYQARVSAFFPMAPKAQPRTA